MGIFIATMAVVAILCYVGYVFTRGKVEEEVKQHELVEVQAEVTARMKRPDKKDKSKIANWTEIKLKNGRMHEIEGELGRPGEIITVKVPRYLVEGTTRKTDVEKEKAAEKARKERKKNR